MELKALGPENAEAYLAFRGRGLAGDMVGFRFAPEGGDAMRLEAWRSLLARDFLVAAIEESQWVGVGGLTRLAGANFDHKGLIWGIYVVPQARGYGAADLIMSGLLDHARTCVRQVQLSVMADNGRARAFYERHGFETYGVEPDSVRLGSSFGDETLMWRRLRD